MHRYRTGTQTINVQIESHILLLTVIVTKKTKEQQIVITSFSPKIH